MPTKPRAELVWQNQAAALVERARRQKDGKAVFLATQLVRGAGVMLFAAGQILNIVRSRATPKSYIEVLEQAGISKTSAEQLIVIYERFGHLPAAEPLAHLGAAKLTVLSLMSDDEITQLASGNEVRGVTIERAATASPKQLELDLAEAHPSATVQRNEWKRRYERLASRYRNEVGRTSGDDDYAARCTAALAKIQQGVCELEKLALMADRLNGSAELVAGITKEAGKVIQHRFGAAKNHLLRTAAAKSPQ